MFSDFDVFVTYWSLHPAENLGDSFIFGATCPEIRDDFIFGIDHVIFRNLLGGYQRYCSISITRFRAMRPPLEGLRWARGILCLPQQIIAQTKVQLRQRVQRIERGVGSA